MSDVYLPAVQPGLNPGGLWMRTCAGDELIDEHALSLDDALPELAEADAERAREAAAAHGGEARTYLYDGDSGACVVTLITTLEDHARR